MHYGYTAQQVQNATPQQVFNIIGIDPNSTVAQKYITFEDIIKAHTVNFMTPQSLKDKILALLRQKYPEVKVTQDVNDPNVFTVDLDG